MKKTYYIRIGRDIYKAFEEFLDENKYDYQVLSFVDTVSNKDSSCLYSTHLTGEEAMMIKLKFPLVGFLDFAKTLGRQIKQH